MGRLHPHIRPHVRAHVRSPLNGPYAASSFHDGISFNAATGRVVIKAPGASPTITTLTSAFTFTGGNQSRIIGPAGFLIPSVTNQPRIEYNTGGGSIRGLLMEASRPNILHQSENWTVEWTTQGGTRTSAGTDMNGVANAMNTLTEDAGATAHRFFNNAVTFTTTAAPWTFSVYLQAGTRRWVQIGVTVGANALWATIDTSNWTFSQNSSVSGAYVANSQGAEQINATTWRVWVSGTLAAENVVPVVAGSNTATPTSLTGPYTYTGDGASTIIASGAQLEAGAFPSSYIPTTTASVVRTADTCVRVLGAEFSATAGSVVVAGRASGGQDAANGQAVYEFSDGTPSERTIFLRVQALDTARYSVFDGGVQQGPLDHTFVNSTAFKTAQAWSLNDLASSFNGGAVLPDATATLPTTPNLYLGNSVGALQMNGHIKSFDYWPVRQPNNYLQQVSA